MRCPRRSGPPLTKARPIHRSRSTERVTLATQPRLCFESRRRHDVGAAAQAPLEARIDRLDTNQRRTVRRQQAGPHRVHPADEIALLLHHAIEAQVARRRLAGQLRSRDMPLLDAHDAHGFQAIGNDVERLAGIEQRRPDALAVSCRCRNFISELARVADAEHPYRASGDARIGHRHEGQGLIAQIKSFDAGHESLACAGASHGDLRPLVASRCRTARRDRAT